MHVSGVGFEPYFLSSLPPAPQLGSPLTACVRQTRFSGFLCFAPDHPSLWGLTLMAHIPDVHDRLSVPKCLSVCWVCEEVTKMTWQVPQESITCSAGGGKALGRSAEVLCVWSGPIPAWFTDNSLT